MAFVVAHLVGIHALLRWLEDGYAGWRQEVVVGTGRHVRRVVDWRIRVVRILSEVVVRDLLRLGGQARVARFVGHAEECPDRALGTISRADIKWTSVQEEWVASAPS